MSQKIFLDKISILLRHYREAAGINQSEIAERLDIGTRTYQRYENGEMPIRVELLYQLSKELNFNLEELFSQRMQKKELSNLKIFPPDNNSYSVNPVLSEIYQSREFKNVLETRNICKIRDNGLFTKFENNLCISHPRQTILNPYAQKFTGLYGETIPSLALYRSPKQVGLAWALLMDNEEAYFENIFSSRNLKGFADLNVKGIFTAKNNQYLILSILDF